MYLNEESWLYLKINTEKKIILENNLNHSIDVEFESFFNEYLYPSILDIREISYSIDEIWNFICSKDTTVIKTYNVLNSKIAYNFSIHYFESEPEIVYLNITKSDVMSQLEFLNYKDFLTGLYNRAYIISMIETILQNHKSKNSALILLDLDGFKKINDSLGHSVGDNCLRKIAVQLKEICKDHLIGRYGGDEFIIFLEDTDYEEIRVLCDKITDINYTLNKDNKKYIVTISCGVAMPDSSKLSFRTLFDEADTSLYQAKKRGKNLTIFLGKNITKAKKSEIAVSKNSEKNNALFMEEIKNIKNLLQFIALTVVVLMTVLIFLFGNYYRKTVEEHAKEAASDSIKTVSEQISRNLDSNIHNWYVNLSITSNLISETDVDDKFKAKIFVLLDSIAEESEFDLCGVLLEDNILIGSTFEHNLADSDLYTEIVNNENVYLGIVKLNESNRFVFAIPFQQKEVNSNDFTIDSKSIKGIVGVINEDKLLDLLTVSAYDKNTYINVILADGQRIMSSKNINVQYLETNSLNRIKNGVSASEYQRITEEIKNGITNVFQFKAFEYDFFAYYSPVGISFYDDELASNWRFLIMIPYDFAVGSYLNATKNILSINYILFATISIIAIVFLVVFNNIYAKNKQLQYTDPITNSINRERLIIDAGKLIKRYSNYCCVHLNINKFRYINEKIGKERADELLLDIFNNIENLLDTEELASRVFADKFVLLLKHEKDKKQIQDRINLIDKKIIEELSEVYNVELDLTYGVYIIPSYVNTFTVCIDKAQIAEQSTSRDAKIVFYTEQMLVHENEEIELEQKAELALFDKQFVVYYQPKKDIISDEWNGAEALVRWQDPTAGLISPAKFIPVFEKNGFISKLDLYVFEEVCKKIRELLDSNVEVSPISINVSKITLEHVDFIKTYKKIMDEYEVDGKYLDFEITETETFENMEQLIFFISQIHALGAYASMDDFGSGNTSLNILTKCDFDFIKLDKSFFKISSFDENTKTAIKTIISLSHELNKKVVAEGIEVGELVDFLKSVDCDFVQGFYYAKPMSFDDYINYIKKVK